MVDSCRDGRELFRISKQMVGQKKDVVGVSCLKDEREAVKVSTDDRKKIWNEHMEKLINIDIDMIRMMREMRLFDRLMFLVVVCMLF